MKGIKQALPAAIFTGTLMTLTACGGTQQGNIADAKNLITTCPGQVSSYIAIDGTASGPESDQLTGPRKQAVAAELARVAACDGRVKVVVFSSSSAATTTLFEDHLTLAGATDQAKARKLEKVAAEAADKIAADYPKALTTLSGGGSDPVAQMRLATEWAQQVGAGKFRLFEITDGFQTFGVTADHLLSDPKAAAAQFPAPDLSAADVTFVGIGETSGDAPPTQVVDAVKAFYQELCTRSGAASCTVVTQAAGGAQ